MKKIGFIGCGNIATAIIKGAINGNVINPADLFVFDINKEKLLEFESFGATATKNIKELAEISEVIFLTVKPQILFSVLEELKNYIKQDALIISPVAGVKIAKIDNALGSNKKIIRVMPNTPLMYSAGATAISIGAKVGQSEADFCEKIFSKSGVTVILPEEQIDAVTGISGSSPAFFMRFANEIINEGVRQGISRENAEKLVLGTMSGTAKMMLESDRSAEELIKAVASPGGTTEAGLNKMNQTDFDKITADVISSAVSRSKELSK